MLSSGKYRNRSSGQLRSWKQQYVTAQSIQRALRKVFSYRTDVMYWPKTETSSLDNDLESIFQAKVQLWDIRKILSKENRPN